MWYHSCDDDVGVNDLSYRVENDVVERSINVRWREDVTRYDDDENGDNSLRRFKIQFVISNRFFYILDWTKIVQALAHCRKSFFDENKLSTCFSALRFYHEVKANARKIGDKGGLGLWLLELIFDWFYWTNRDKKKGFLRKYIDSSH